MQCCRLKDARATTPAMRVRMIMFVLCLFGKFCTAGAYNILHIATDACPWGIGGISEMDGRVVAYFHDALTDADIARIAANRAKALAKKRRNGCPWVPRHGRAIDRVLAAPS